MITITNFFWEKKHIIEKSFQKIKKNVLEFKKVYNQSVLNYAVLLNYYKDNWH